MSEKTRSKVFDMLVEKFVAEGTFSFDDATKPLNLIITEEHVLSAKECDESYCVVAQAITDSQVSCVAASVGESITKLMFEGGKVIRYSTTIRLKKALDRFDSTGEWLLPAGVYTLRVPPEGDKLSKNMSERTRKRRKEAWEGFQQRFKASKNRNGDESGKVGSHDGLVGGSRSKGQSVPARQITVLTDGGHTRKRGTRKPATESKSKS